MDLLIYLPAHASGPVPVLLTPGFFPNSSRVDDPGVRRGFMWNRDHQRVPAPVKSPFGEFDVLQLTSQGFGVAMVYYGDIEPDFAGGIPYGVEGAYLKPGQSTPGPREWGAIDGPRILVTECVRCDDCERLYQDTTKCAHWLIIDYRRSKVIPLKSV